jgi:hypothetical protein
MTKTMWAVGVHDGECGWGPIDAPTREAAVAAFMDESKFKIDPENIEAMRVPAWDALDKVTPTDWVMASEGLTHCCSHCDEQCGLDDDPPAQIIDGELICGFCCT